MFNTVNILRFFFLIIIIVFITQSYGTVYAKPFDNLSVLHIVHNNIYISSFLKYPVSDNKLIIVGSIASPHNLSITSPIIVTLGLNAYNVFSKKSEIITEHPFKDVIYNIDEPLPFKFEIDTTKYHVNLDSVPYVYKIEHADKQSTEVNTFKLAYDESKLGPFKELHGNVTNTSPNVIKNLILYAIVHAKNGTQLDSVKTLIPIIPSQKTVSFSLIPNKIIRSSVFIYSCVGGDLQNFNSYKMINLNSGKTLGYKFSGFMTIDSIVYDYSTNQFRLSVNNVYPPPATLSLQFMSMQKSPLFVLLDGKKYKSKILNNNITINIDLFIPQGKHEISIQGFTR